MAKDLKQIKNQIKAVNQTLSITQAMYTTSITKLNRASINYNSYLDFLKLFKPIFADIGLISESLYFDQNIDGQKVYIIITSDKGLCGSFHNDIFKSLANILDDKSDIVVIGRKGFSYYKDKNIHIINKKNILNRDDVNIIDYKDIISTIRNLYKDKVIKELNIVYNHSISMMSRKLVVEKLLPIDKSILDNKTSTQYIYDNMPSQLFDDIVGIYLEQAVYGAISDSKQAEMQARMMAMKSASDNAKKVLEKLSIIYNNARQEQITSELIDVINASRR